MVRNRGGEGSSPGTTWLSSEERATLQLRAVRERAAAACASSEATRRRFAEAGVRPETVDLEDLRRLPPIRKRDFPSIQGQAPPFGGLATVPPGELGHIFVSPGPIYDPEGREEDFWNLREALQAGGFRKGDIVQNTFSYHLTPAGMMFDTALRGMGCAVIPAGVGNTEIQARAMVDLKVTAFVGTPSFLVSILEKACEAGLDRDGISLELAYVAGEILAASLRKKLNEEQGVTVRQGYITADLGTVGYECPRENGYHVPDNILVEVVDPVSAQPVAEGEVGEVVVTTLKAAYPLFRFATGDLSSLTLSECGCGRTSSRLLGILGRADEVTKVKGMFIHPGMVTTVLARLGEGLRGQAVVTREGHRDRLVLRIAGGDDREDLAGQAAEIIREVMRVRGEVEMVGAEDLGPRFKLIDDQRSWE